MIDFPCNFPQNRYVFFPNSTLLYKKLLVIQLFDFDLEVQPIIEVLVGKTIEQALIEVLEEEELAAIREQQRRFLEIRAAETAETQRLEEKEKRLLREKERRTKEYEEGSRLQKEMEERIAASVLMQGYMADLLPSVLEGLESEGFLIDSIKEDIDESFMPWLMREVTHEVTEIVSSRDVLTGWCFEFFFSVF